MLFEPGLQKEKRKEIEAILKANKSQLNSDAYHIWGLIYYMSDEDIQNKTEFALKKFKVAYEMDNDNFLACLYIAHCYHDMQILDQALTYYELVDQDKLRAFQQWRYIKLIEQIGYCHYQLGRKKIGRQKFKEVLEWHKKLPFEERNIPSEMLSCLPPNDSLALEMKNIDKDIDDE